MHENNPVEHPNTKNEKNTAKTSTKKSIEPIFRLVCFFTIIAMISVPPLDAPILKRRAEPIPGSNTAKISSKKGSFVSGSLIGHRCSSKLIPTDKIILV